MGKVVKFTGSKLLGTVLRRLRGGRSLKQIAELSKTPPLSERVAPVAAPTLSQVENGISFPSLETLHSLAQIYQTPVQQLLDLVVQDRLAAQFDPPESLKAARERFRRAHDEGAWHEALSVACWAEQQAEGSAAALQWRTNRAFVLRRLGMRQDGLALLEQCLEDPELPESAAWKVHAALADAHAMCGQVRQAAMHHAAARDAAPAELSEGDRFRLATSRAYALLSINFERDEPVEREVREAARLLAEVATLELSPDETLLVSVHRAACHALLGNRLVAERDLDNAIERARAQQRRRPLIEALAVLGVIRRIEGKAREAIALLEEACSEATEAGDLTQAFECCFEAYRAAVPRHHDKAALLLKRCQRLHPFAGARTLNTVRFERSLQVEEG